MIDLPETKSLLVSVLSLGRAGEVLALLASLPGWLAEFGHDNNIPVHLVVRNNHPQVDFDEVRLRLVQCEAEHPGLRCTLVAGEPNLGFGRGHNENYRRWPADYLLILNDDIGFPHLAWLAEAVAWLARDPQTACVGASENPQYLNPMFGNGHGPQAFAVETLKYAEASVLLFNGKVFEELGMFDERMQWATCEDADLSLRAQQLGYRLHWMSMPHEHWRSTSVNALPAPVRCSILEHNRGALFASWSHTLASGRIGRLEVFDLCSDGMGDVFCVLPHLRAWLATLPVRRREQVVINTNHPHLMELLGATGVRITSIADRSELLATLDTEGVTALHSIREVNYALPINLHPLLCGMLGLPVCDRNGMTAFRDTLRDLAKNRRHSKLPPQYCVIHLEFTRDHQGRGLAPASIKAILACCSRLFETIVLVGTERRLAVEHDGSPHARVVDLQSKLPLKELMGVIAAADYFVGIDSFPAHVAQGAGIPSAIFFGAVHPSARAWDEALVWPLVAKLDCIGCYHSQLESSAPFCMRHDVACSLGPDSESLQHVLDAMLRGERYGWSEQRRRFDILQAKWLGFMRHHPSPPERVVRPAATGNELVSNLVYRVLDHAAEIAGTRYCTSAMNGLTERLQDLEAKLFARDVELDEMRRLASRTPKDASVPSRRPLPTVQISRLTDMTFVARRCSITLADQWLEVTAMGADPQLYLPVIRGHGGRIRVRLTSIAQRPDTLQVFWSTDPAAYSEERQRSVKVGPSASNVELQFDLAAKEKLHLRIDPLLAVGRLRLRGAVSGPFELSDAAMPPPEATVPAAAALNLTAHEQPRRKRQPRSA